MTLSEVVEKIAQAVCRAHHKAVLQDFEAAGLPMPGSVDLHLALDQLVEATWRDFHGYAEAAVAEIDRLTSVAKRGRP
jgi:hypothetical protein